MIAVLARSQWTGRKRLGERIENRERATVKPTLDGRRTAACAERLQSLGVPAI
jgi:hypothetical protein